jgi:hypothetical protein
MPRQQVYPEYRGGAGPNRAARTTEWMPSAPITTSAASVCPSANRTLAPSGRASTATHSCPYRATPGGRCAARRGDQVGPVGHADQLRQPGPPLHLVGPERHQQPRAVRHPGLRAEELQRAGADRVAGADVVERAERVQPQADAGADLAQLRGSLVHGHVDPDLAQRDRRRQPRDARPDDDDAHARPPWFRRRMLRKYEI